MRLVRTLTAAAVLVSVMMGAQAQGDYPNKSITLVLPLGAGGARTS